VDADLPAVTARSMVFCNHDRCKCEEHAQNPFFLTNKHRQVAEKVAKGFF